MLRIELQQGLGRGRRQTSGKAAMNCGEILMALICRAPRLNRLCHSRESLSSTSSGTGIHSAPDQHGSRRRLPSNALVGGGDDNFKSGGL